MDILPFLSNDIKAPIEALEIYRNKDLLSYITKKMQEVLDELDIIECLKYLGISSRLVK